MVQDLFLLLQFFCPAFLRIILFIWKAQWKDQFGQQDDFKEPS